MSHLPKDVPYAPLPGSHAELMVEWLRIKGEDLSSVDLAEVASVDAKQVVSILAPAVKHGLIVRTGRPHRATSWRHTAPLQKDAAAVPKALKRMAKQIGEDLAVLAFAQPPIHRITGCANAMAPAWTGARPPCSVFDLARHAQDCQA